MAAERNCEKLFASKITIISSSVAFVVAVVSNCGDGTASRISWHPTGKHFTFKKRWNSNLFDDAENYYFEV